MQNQRTQKTAEEKGGEVKDKVMTCERENTCYQCDDEECIKRGDIEADCRLIICHRGGKCFECEYNENNRGKETE